MLGTTAIAALIGWASVILFNLDGAQFTQGSAETARIEALTTQQTQVADLTIPGQVLSFIPTNIFQDLAGLRSTSTIAVVVFSAFVGIAYMGIKKKQPENAALFNKGLQVIQSIVMRIVTLVLRLTPYGILALMTKMMATSSYQAIVNLGLFVVASYAALLVVPAGTQLDTGGSRRQPDHLLQESFPGIELRLHCPFQRRRTAIER